MTIYKVKWWIAKDASTDMEQKEKIFMEESQAIAFKYKLQRAKQLLDIYTDIKIQEVEVDDPKRV